MNKYSGHPFGSFGLAFPTTALLSISVYCYFSDRLFKKKKKSHTNPVDLVLKHNDTPHFCGKPLRLMCGTQEPNRIPDCNSALPQPLAAVLPGWQKAFSQSWRPRGIWEGKVGS